MSGIPEASNAYERVRRNEQRLLDDHIVQGLPAAGGKTPYAAEWRVRERTMRRVLRIAGTRPLSILEVGCGNGWLSAHLAAAGHNVTGLDTGATELAQAARVFNDHPVTWVHGDPWAEALSMHRFHLVLFAASIQYFPHLPTILDRCRELLHQDGEVLIVDSPFYTNTDAAHRARERSRVYYGSVGVPEMAAHYHHHTLQELAEATSGAALTCIPPRGRLVALLNGRYPFPIVRIRF